jgi:hypothetical protein
MTRVPDRTRVVFFEQPDATVGDRHPSVRRSTEGVHMTTVRRSAAALLCATTLVAACSSSTVIRSNPSGAKVFLDNAYVGMTPYTLSDKKIVGSSTSVRLEYPGMEPTTFTLSRSEELQIGALIGGLFLLVPFLWIMGYKGDHTIELRPPNQGGYATGPHGARGRAIEMQQVEQVGQ